VDGHEPQVAQAGLQHFVDVGGLVEPIQEGGHLPLEALRRRGREMDALFADGSGDNLHRAGAVVTPGSAPDLLHAATPSGKQRRVPSEKPFAREYLIVMAGGVEHHLDDSLDPSVSGLQRTDVDAQPARNRRSHLIGFQLFALDRAALEHVRGQRSQDGFLPEVEAERFHASDQATLPMAHQGKRPGEAVRIPMKSGPAFELVDVHSPPLLRRL
jgi:hypothetical protein